MTVDEDVDITEQLTLARDYTRKRPPGAVLRVSRVRGIKTPKLL